MNFTPKIVKNHKFYYAYVPDILQTTVQPSHKPLRMLFFLFLLFFDLGSKRLTTGREKLAQRLIATPAIRTFKNKYFYPKFNKKGDFFWNFTNPKKLPGCPKFQKSRIFRGPPKFSIFIKIGVTFSRIIKNWNQHNYVKCNNLRVSRNYRAEIQIFPRKMLTIISSFRRNLGSLFSRIPGNSRRQNS